MRDDDDSGESGVRSSGFGVIGLGLIRHFLCCDELVPLGFQQVVRLWICNITFTVTGNVHML